MSISDLPKQNNPDIIDIVSLYITNMTGLNQAGGYENANKVIDLISQKRTQIHNLSKKMKDADILREYNRTNKVNYVQLNKIETMIRIALSDSIRKDITNDDTGRLDPNKFGKNFALFLDDDEIKQLGRDAIDSSKNAQERKGFSKLNRGGSIESDGKAVGELVEKMVEKIFEDYELYEEYIYTCQTPIDLRSVYTNLNSYFQKEIDSMQSYTLEHSSPASIR